MKRTRSTTTENDDNIVALTPNFKSWYRTFKYDSSPADENEVDRLWALHPEEHAKIMMYGKLVPVPRWQQTYGTQSYKFSGVENAAIPIPPELQVYMDYANTTCKPYFKHFTTKSFNMAFLNWYNDGNHYIGAHSDDERQIVKNKNGEALIFSISFGATREFVFEPREKDIDYEISLDLSHCSALLMGGLCQKTHKHTVPKIKGKKATTVGRRINMTFRMFK